MKQMIAGVFGCGRIGQMHIKNLIKEGVKIKTVCDVKVDHLKDFSKENNLYMTTLENEIWDDKDINAIFIFTSTNTHIDYILKAVKKVEYIFCEKPLSMDTNETLAAWEKVKKFDDKIQIGFNRRFDPNFATLQKRLSDGAIGKMNVLKITSRDPEPPGVEYLKVSGGIYLDMAIHDFDMARFISRSEVEQVFAMGDCLINKEIASVGDIDTSIIQLKFKNNSLGQIDISRKASYGYDQRLEVLGIDGMLKAENEQVNTIEVHNEKGIMKDNPPYFFIERYVNAYNNEYKAFINSFQKNIPVECRFSDGVKAQLIATAVKESLETNQPVTVKTI